VDHQVVQDGLFIELKTTHAQLLKLL